MKPKRVFLPGCVVVALLFLACGSNDSKSKRSSAENQPFKDTAAWEWVAPIDGSGYCGPASLYHIICYYGDFGFYYYKNLADNTWAEDTLEVPVINENDPMNIDDTAFGMYIQPDGNGSSWAFLERVSKLYFSRNNNDNLFDVYVCSSHTVIEEVEVRRSRLSYIREHLLNNDMPVVIHLESSIPFFGHYVTLIGYDSAKGKVYYVDSLKHDSGIQTVAVNDFLGAWFYTSGQYYSARWDGEWMAFWHPEAGSPCNQCGD